MTAKIGDLVTVDPSRAGVYLVVGEDPERENNRATADGIILGKLYSLYDSNTQTVIYMHEKWVEVIRESRRSS